jgi:Flp pilus assembly protein TadD
LEQKPAWTEARFQYAVALDGLGKTVEAIEQYRRVVSERPHWDAPLNNLAWHLATNDDPQLRNPAEAVRLAEAACRASNRQNIAYLDTLATALAANGQLNEALTVARQGLSMAEQARRDPLAQSFRALIADIEQRAGR